MSFTPQKRPSLAAVKTLIHFPACKMFTTTVMSPASKFHGFSITAGSHGSPSIGCVGYAMCFMEPTPFMAMDTDRTKIKDKSEVGMYWQGWACLIYKEGRDLCLHCSWPVRFLVKLKLV